MKRRLRTVFLAPLLGLLMIGCGDPSGEISGKVNFQGKPLAAEGAMVSFIHPTQGPFVSVIDPDGSYTVHKVPPGEVKITIMVPSKRRPDIIQQKMRAAVKSGDMKVSPEDRAKMSPAERASLEAAAPPPAIPLHYNDPEKSGLKYTVAAGRQTHDIDLK